VDRFDHERLLTAESDQSAPYCHACFKESKGIHRAVAKNCKTIFGLDNWSSNTRTNVLKTRYKTLKQKLYGFCSYDCCCEHCAEFTARYMIDNNLIDTSLDKEINELLSQEMTGGMEWPMSNDEGYGVDGEGGCDLSDFEQNSSDEEIGQNDEMKETDSEYSQVNLLEYEFLLQNTCLFGNLSGQHRGAVCKAPSSTSAACERCDGQCVFDTISKC